MDDCTEYLAKFISSEWDGIKNRLDDCDLQGNSSWSEAIAESMFSVWSDVVHHRASLTVKNTEALCRLVSDGPAAGTKAAENLAKMALSDERRIQFTTKEWQRGIVSKIVANIQTSSRGHNDDVV